MTTQADADARTLRLSREALELMDAWMQPDATAPAHDALRQAVTAALAAHRAARHNVSVAAHDTSFDDSAHERVQTIPSGASASVQSAVNAAYQALKTGENVWP